MQRDAFQVIGRPVLRREGSEKLTGARQYIDDMNRPEMIYGITVRSSIPRGEIERIEFAPGIPWDQVTVVTAADIPGKNMVALLTDDQPMLVDKQISHQEEAIVLLGHPDKHLLEKARLAVKIYVKPLPAVLDIETARQAQTLIWGKDNAFKHIAIDKGDVEQAMRQAYRVVEGTYVTEAQEQLYIEPNGMLASYDAERGVEVWGSMQCPFYVHKALMELFRLPANKIRVIQTETGGGFGGKEDYPSIIAGHAALLAHKSGRPVKMIYDRAEDMVATTKRHPSRTHHRTAVDRDGKILAIDVDFTLDGGAYTTLSPVVLSRGAIHAAGPYDIANIRIRARALATNHPPHGAFRGFGAPQSLFACERHLNKVAAAVGLSPSELRRRNFVKPGGRMATDQIMRDNIDLESLMQRALAISGYEQKRVEWACANAESKSPIRRGIGFATFMHGAGFTGSGERVLASEAAVLADAKGVVHVLASSTEIGQGTITVFTQIAAETLRLPCEQVSVTQPDTSQVPNSGPTVASRSVMVVGKLIENACLELRQKLFDAGLLTSDYKPVDFCRACQQYYAQASSPLQATAKYQLPADIQWDDQKYRGDAYVTFAWACYVAEVEIDLTSYQTKVVDFTAVQEAGRMINPVLASGQIEGGVVQGLGYALYEKVVWREGRMANGRMSNYIVPTSMDVPRIKVEFMDCGPTHGPGGGAKGIGELPMDGTAPAIANAIEHALGVAVDAIPCLPETLMNLVQRSKSS